MARAVQLEVGSPGRRLLEAVPEDVDEPPDAPPPVQHRRGSGSLLDDQMHVPACACSSAALRERER